MKFSTKAVHQGVAKDSSFNSVITPLYPSSTFYFDKIGVNKGFDYTRSGNPTRAGLEENIAALEGGIKGFCTCTGMAAETAVLHLLKPGQHVVAGNDIYGGTWRLMDTVFRALNMDFSFVNMTSVTEVEAAIKDNTAMLWIETPSNPLLNIVDIKALTSLVRGKDIISVVDNTFMTPYLQQPFSLGADVVVHSTTKYINGHSDVVGGAIVTNSEQLAQDIGFMVNALGLGESPWDSWLVLRGVKSLSHRMKAHCANAGAIATFLNGHDKVRKVYYPGLSSHPQHELAKTQMAGFGGMVSFDLDLTQVNLDTFFNGLKFFSLAESLGGVESLIESPWYMSHASMDESARIDAGISKGTIRLSTGIEDADDLIADLARGLECKTE